MQVSHRWENIISCKIIQATPLYICRQGREKRRSSCKKEYFIDERKSRYKFKENYKGNYNKFKIQIQRKRHHAATNTLSSLGKKTKVQANKRGGDEEQRHITDEMTSKRQARQRRMEIQD